MAVLELQNVTYTYKSATNPAVKDVNCVFEQGQLYAVVGPSGSGKSTLLSMMAGLDLPTDGEVLFGGESLASINLDRYRRESIAMIFQAFQLFPLLTILENVCYPMELCGVKPAAAKPRAAELLESVGITKEQMKRFPSKLSGGEQQRVAIARSLAAGARTILADEPTGNLDVSNTENVMGILKKLAHDEGYLVIVVTHDSEVAQMADVKFEMRDGVMTEK
ncbi:MAG: ABC transporter ATP-binding protein [Oscillospiraceae bacterium]|jgi:putative ABC transport system ATP-binding protein|nr:ABC transporter ATP-binding protein [Oscillospiraceae bacterium]